MAVPHMLRNIFLLSACWCLGIAAVFIQISTSTVAARELQDSARSTIPLGLLLLCSAVSTQFVPRLVHDYGHLPTFLGGAISGCIGGGIMALGLEYGGNDTAFALMLVGSFVQGFMYACTNMFRFTVTVFATKEFTPQAIAIVVGGGLLSIVLGPELNKSFRTLLSREFAGSYVLLCVLYAALALVVLCIEWPSPARHTASISPAVSTTHIELNASKVGTSGWQPVDNAEKHPASPVPAGLDTPERPLLDIVRTEIFVTTLVLESISYSAMGGLMTATPLGMKEDGFSFDDITLAIQMHMLGMFFPSFFSGKLVQRLGALNTIIVGFAVLLAGACTFFSGRTKAHYVTGIAVVGVGWNLSFVGATAVFTTLFTPPERRKVIALNDLVVIGVLATALFSAGYTFDGVGGWDNFVLVYCVYACVALLVALAEKVRPCFAANGRSWEEEAAASLKG